MQLTKTNQFKKRKKIECTRTYKVSIQETKIHIQKLNLLQRLFILVNSTKDIDSVNMISFEVKEV